MPLFLPVLSWPKEVLAPLRMGGRDRIMSPSGASSLITSAPRSANRRVQCGPAIVVVKSTTRRRSKALFVLDVIASEAKQSHAECEKQDRDCFVLPSQRKQ